MHERETMVAEAAAALAAVTGWLLGEQRPPNGNAGK
jgi:hypothetical protein